ncbi:YkgJ family cysteine cluster protein [Roseateles sp.]|uniref:YkgJ family cysteine cluster protein n=1 Tax=Roseateles sp. TaxID=1971397 RepID=UPI003BA76399
MGAHGGGSIGGAEGDNRLSLPLARHEPGSSKQLRLRSQGQSWPYKLCENMACRTFKPVHWMSQESVSISNPCQQCGACCACFRVSFYWAEAPDLPDSLTEHLGSHFACMAGTNQTQPRCQALQGEVGQAVSCAVYVQRPNACREVQVGDEKCQRARHAHGLPPLPERT